MGDSLITITVIFLAAIIMFVFPLMTIADRNDDVAQTAVQTANVQTVNQITNTGVLSGDMYDDLIESISATGNVYEVEIEIKTLDENIGKKAAQSASSIIGENRYYVLYTTQIVEQIFDPITGGSKKMGLKEGDIVSIKIKNTNSTIAQSFKSFIYSVSGNDTYQIYAEHSGVVTANGSV